MFTSNPDINEQMIISTMESLVPEDHLLRKIDKYVSFRFIYDITEPYYSDVGRPAIDPVILFKIPMIKHLYGISSMRRTIEEIHLNAAYRWFIGIPFGKKVPSHTTYSQNYIRRFRGTDVFERIFENILNQLIENDLLDVRNIHIDSTHVKASANKKRYIKETVRQSKKVHEDEILEDVNALRRKQGKKPLKKNVKHETKTAKVSKTDPDSGWYVKGEREHQFAYSAHVGTDQFGYVLGVETTPGNVHDTQVFDNVYRQISERFKNRIQGVAVDAGYRTGIIAKHITDNNHIPHMPYKRPSTPKGHFKPYEFVYDEYFNEVICPNNKILKFRRTIRDGKHRFLSDPEDCAKCPVKKKCTSSDQKRYDLDIYHDVMDYVDDLRYTDYGKDVYRRRGETVERIFGDFKEKHNGRYTRYRGLEKVSNEQLLIFAVMNIKKMAIWMDKKTQEAFDYCLFSIIYTYFHQKKALHSTFSGKERFEKCLL